MPIQSVRRAIAILREFSVDEPELGVTQLSERLDLHKSTVHRLLASLRRAGLVKRVPTSRRYRLAVGLIELGHVALYNHALLQVVHPYVHYLADALGETALLAVRDDDEILIVLQVRSPDLRDSVRWVPRAPLHCTSTGRIFLAHMPENEVNGFLEKELTPRTAATISDPAELRAELGRVREEGFATSFEEYEEGINAIAVPIKKPDGTVAAALAASGYSYSFTREKAVKSLEIMRGIATDISHKLAALPPEELDLLS
jgi:DNA-binding IclR family transcriptional regulator